MRLGLKTILFLLLLGLTLSSNLLWANEDKAAGAKPESYSGKQDQNWEVVQNELAALKAKLDAQASLVQSLIEKKSVVTGDELSAVIEETKKQHQKYENLVLDYNKKNDEFLTRYPERGLKEKRVYTRVKMKSLNSFEKDLSVKGRLKQLHEKVLKQYPGVVETQRSEARPKNSTSPQKRETDITSPIQIKK